MKSYIVTLWNLWKSFKRMFLRYSLVSFYKLCEQSNSMYCGCSSQVFVHNLQYYNCKQPHYYYECMPIMENFERNIFYWYLGRWDVDELLTESHLSILSAKNMCCVKLTLAKVLTSNKIKLCNGVIPQDSGSSAWSLLEVQVLHQVFWPKKIINYFKYR